MTFDTPCMNCNQVFPAMNQNEEFCSEECYYEYLQTYLEETGQTGQTLEDL